MQIAAAFRRGLICCVLFAGVAGVNSVFAADASAQLRTGTVKKVFDGDTVELNSGEIIRLLGIDAPESNSRNRKIPPQPFYLESRAALTALVAKKKVRLRVSESLVGPYGRTLAYLYLRDDTDVQLEMLRGGFAMMTAYPPDLDHIAAYSKAERHAQQNRAGMWGDPYFAVQSLSDGAPKKDGPARIKGIVTSVSTTGRRIEIIIGENLTLQIIHPAWHRYWQNTDAKKLIGKHVTAQGRIRSKSKTMRITHPVMLRIGALNE